MVDYYYKYTKYKQKYLELLYENKQIGGGKYPIIHISGPSGAGKTTLGNKLKYKYTDKIIVKDIDDLRYDFVKKKYGGYKNVWNNPKFVWNADKYQEYIDIFIKNHKSKPIVFVGLNHMPWWNKRLYYNMHATNKYFIKLNSDLVYKQKCSRFMEDMFVKNKDILINSFIKNEKETQKKIYNSIKNECGYEKTTKMNDIWNTDYKNQGYEFLSRENIFEKVCDILNEFL
jgi:hypothetical protein